MHRRSPWPILLLGLAAVTACTPPEPGLGPEPAAGATASLPTATAAPAWPEGTDCRQITAAITRLPDLQRRLLQPEASPVAVAMVEDGQALPQERAAQLLVADLPVPVIGQLDAAGPRCLLLLERTGTAAAAPRRPLAHEMVRSTYGRGTRRVGNPEHAALKQAMREVKEDEGPRILATGDPATDLVGLIAGTVLSGMDLFARRRQENELRAALAATPAAQEEPSWEPYSYGVTTVEAARAGSLRAALIDRQTGAAWGIGEQVREVRTFRVASGRHTRDRDVLEGRSGSAVVEADLEVWEKGGPRPALSTLLSRLAVAPTLPAGSPNDPMSLAAAWRDPLPPTHAIQPAAGATMQAPGPTSNRLVEQVVTADGTRHYRLVTPAAEASP